MMGKLGTVVESPIGSNSDMKRYIDSVNQNFGLKREPWCAMSASDMLKQGDAIYPKIWSAMALSFKKAEIKYTLKQVLNNECQPKPGDIIVYDYGAGRGHIDFVVSYENGNWVLIGGYRDNRIALWKGTTNRLIMNKAKYVVEVTGDYSYETNQDKIHPAPLYKGGIRQEVLEKKLATVYHSKFNGRRMANGKIYNEWNYTVASNDYQLNSTITIYNKKKTDSVVVTVTDRMKYNNRIDLSLGLSKRFNIRKDTILVKYEAK